MIEDHDIDDEIIVDREPQPAQPAEAAELEAKRSALNESLIKRAVEFMENAVKNNTNPTAFASAARNLVGADVLKFIQKVGIDKLLDTVVDPGSPLTTVRGRQFARQVAAILVGGDSAPPVAAVVPVAAAAPAANDEAPADDDAEEDDDELDNALDDLGGGEGGEE